MKPAEAEFFLGGLLEPELGLLRMNVPAPKQREPYVGIKQIQCVYRSARLSLLAVPGNAFLKRAADYFQRLLGMFLQLCFEPLESKFFG